MACPSLDDLLQLLRNEAGLENRAAIERHLAAGCSTCTENKNWLAGLLNTMSQDDSFEFSPDLIAWSVAQFKLGNATSSKRSLIGRVLFDSLAALQPADVRSVRPATASSRQMFFRAGDYDLDLRLTSDDDGKYFQVIGQILRSDKKQSAELMGLDVCLDRSPVSSAPPCEHQAVTDKRGIFRLRDLPAADYELKVYVPEGEILIQGISTHWQ